MIPCEILKKIRQIELRANRIVSVKCFAVLTVLSFAFAFVGCQSTQPKDPCKAIIAALNNEDWNTLQKLAPTNGIAKGSIEIWKKYPVRVGKLMDNWENHVFTEGEKPCTVYSFLLDNKDGSVSPHWLQVVVRKQPNGVVELVDFWKFGW